jgi:tripartite-type tricarboxylate transporter receptor subunit TctC
MRQLIAVGIAGMLALTAQAADYPTKPIRVLVPFAPGVDASIWVGLFAPKGTPKDDVARLYQASAAVLQMPDVKQRYASVGGAETTTMGSAAFNKRISSELERYRKVAAQVGIQQQ